MDKYDWRLDYRRNTSEVGDVANYFPSVNTTYCEHDDYTCAQCRATSFKTSIDGSENPSQFCVGAGGCVCVGFCESSVWKPVVVDMLCDELAPTDTLKVTLTGPMRTIALIVVMMISIPVVLIVGNSLRVRALRERERRRLRQARLDARSPPLALDGWKALRDVLIENEHQGFAHQEEPTVAPASPSGSHTGSQDDQLVKETEGDETSDDAADDAATASTTTTALPRLQLLS
ncbi:hypothetical protein FI667_g11514, partial [Globisporangium splendens]